jgi:septum formation protein
MQRRLILASSSPRRRELLRNAGYRFEVISPADSAECGICSRETAPELVARLAFQKARDVAQRQETECLVLGADTVAHCMGHILGKPVDRDHARQMLTMLRGRRHDVYTGIYLWSIPDGKQVVDVCRTELEMEALSERVLETYLDSGKWEGKAGAFGYQDGNDWVRVIDGSESNVVGLPLERLAERLAEFT